MRLRKSKGYVLLVDIHGFGGMKKDLDESDWVPLMDDFFLGSEKAIQELTISGLGNGSIIGDGFIVFSETMTEKEWLYFISNTVRENLLQRFRKFKSNLPIDYLDLTFVTGYCNFYIRSEVDVIGIDIDELFDICRNAKGNELQFNRNFYERQITNTSRTD